VKFWKLFATAAGAVVAWVVFARPARIEKVI
jgi:hypothetical protein